MRFGFQSLKCLLRNFWRKLSELLLILKFLKVCWVIGLILMRFEVAFGGFEISRLLRYALYFVKVAALKQLEILRPSKELQSLLQSWYSIKIYFGCFQFYFYGISMLDRKIHCLNVYFISFLRDWFHFTLRNCFINTRMLCNVAFFISLNPFSIQKSVFVLNIISLFYDFLSFSFGIFREFSRKIVVGMKIFLRKSISFRIVLSSIVFFLVAKWNPKTFVLA